MAPSDQAILLWQFAELVYDLPQLLHVNFAHRVSLRQGAHGSSGDCSRLWSHRNASLEACLRRQGFRGLSFLGGNLDIQVV